MEIQQSTIKTKAMLINYIKYNKIMSAIALYFFVSVMLKVLFSIDILMPCLWNSLFHFDCPGCGLTTAFIKVLSFDFHGAFHTNSLVFLLIPFGLFLVYSDISKFKKRIN